MTELQHVLERTIVILAERTTVFQYFKSSKFFADWWGAGSTIEGKPGGKVHIRYPNGVIASGEVLEIIDNERIVFTYGYESGKPIPSGASRVTFTLQDHPEGTELKLRHEFSDPAVRDAHIAGWRYQMALFANVTANEQHVHFGETADEYFRLWNIPDSQTRAHILEKIVSPDIEFRDAFGCVRGHDDLNAHISAVQIHMPGVTLSRSGELQHCQGFALVPWVAKRKDDSEFGRGTNMFQLMPEGQIRRIIGFWSHQ